MGKIFKRLLSIMVIGLLLINCITHISYAQSPEEELKAILTEYKEQLGDLNQFKEVVDEVYDELNEATEVTPELKESLIKSIKKLQTIDGMNPLIATVLIQELEGQVNILTNDNLSEMQEEIKVIKEWVDGEIEKDESNGPSEDENTQEPSEKPEEDESNNPDPLPDDENKNDKPSQDTNNTQKDPTQSGNKLPNTGKTGFVTVGVCLLSATAIISVFKYKKLKDIK